MHPFIRQAAHYITRMDTHELMLVSLLVIAAGLFFLRGFVPRP